MENDQKFLSKKLNKKRGRKKLSNNNNQEDEETISDNENNSSKKNNRKIHSKDSVDNIKIKIKTFILSKLIFDFNLLIKVLEPQQKLLEIYSKDLKNKNEEIFFQMTIKDILSANSSNYFL